MNKKQLVTLLLLLLVSLFASACDDFGNPLDPDSVGATPFKKNEKVDYNKPKQPVGEPADQQSAQLEDYQRPTYPNGVRRNPFQPDPAFLVQQAQFENENARVKEPLEEFGLGQLRLAAILSGIAVPKAMFIDPQGLGHFAKVGDRIGKNGYVISAIRENSVTLTSDSDKDGDNSDKNDVGTVTQIIRLSDQLGSEEQQLSDEDRAALARILNSTAGKKAVQQSLNNSEDSNSYDNNNSTAPGTEGGQ